jgi:hypothetical protein
LAIIPLEDGKTTEAKDRRKAEDERKTEYTLAAPVRNAKDHV